MIFHGAMLVYPNAGIEHLKHVLCAYCCEGTHASPADGVESPCGLLLCATTTATSAVQQAPKNIASHTLTYRVHTFRMWSCWAVGRMRRASQCQNLTASHSKYPEHLASDSTCSIFSGDHGVGVSVSPMLTPTMLLLLACLC